jgi:flagellar motor switch protein FliN/FliY
MTDFSPKQHSNARSLAPEEFAFLSDLKLKLTVSLGSLKMTLKEIVELTTGSVIQLPTPTSAGVEVSINGVLLARGEIISVEDRAVIQLKEIIHPERF